GAAPPSRPGGTRSRWCTDQARTRCSFDFLEVGGRHAGDEPALGGLRPSPPWHDAVSRARQKTCAVDERRPAGDIEATEDVSPTAIAAHGGAQAARAIRQAPHWRDHDAAAFGGFGRRRGQDCTGAWFALRS